MAKLPIYNSTETPAQPSESGAPRSGIYQGLASGLHTAGEAVQRYNEQQETTKLAVDASALHAKLTNEWEDLKVNGDITDPETVAKFNDSAAQQVDALSDNIGSRTVQNHAAMISQDIKSSFSMKTLADHSTAVGQRAVTNLETSENSLSASVYSDPHSLDETVRMAGLFVGMSGVPSNKQPELVAKMTKHLALSAVDGTIDGGNPQTALSDLARGRYDRFLTGEEKSAAVAKANSAIDALDRDARAAAAAARQKIKDDAGVAAQNIVGQLPIDDKGHLVLYPGAMSDALKIKDDDTQRSVTDMLRSVQTASEKKEHPTSDDATWTDLRKRIFDPTLARSNPVSQNELMSAYANGKLDDKDFASLRSGLAGNDDPQTKQYNSDVQNIQNTYKSLITKSSLINVDSIGDYRAGQWQRDVDSFARNLFTKEGATPATTAKVDAYARSRIPSYTSTMQQGVDATVLRATGGTITPLPPPPQPVTQRNPGESAAAYLKRIGG